MGLLKNITKNITLPFEIQVSNMACYTIPIKSKNTQYDTYLNMLPTFKFQTICYGLKL